MNNEIEKPEQPSPDDVLDAITSFNDPSIIIGIFKELGWSYTFEIKEWLVMAKQNANLSVKSKALIQLRKLLREAAEAAGYIANVSSTTPNPQGGQTTFSAKRIAGILNPVKKIESTEIKETQNDKKEIRTEPNRGSDRGQSQNEGRTQAGRKSIESDSPEPIRDTGCAFPAGDVESGGTEPADGGEAPGRPDRGTRNIRSGDSDETPDNPCIKTRPPTCDQDLFPGISSAED